MAKTKWDDPENEATNSFVSWGQPGDFVLGTLTAVKDVKSTLPDRVGELQKVYTVKVKECEYHTLDEKKRVVETPVVPESGTIVSVGGRAGIDGRMATVKIGQVFGLKFINEEPSKTKGYNPTKIIKVFTPKGADGSFEMDADFMVERKLEEEGSAF